MLYSETFVQILRARIVELERQLRELHMTVERAYFNLQKSDKPLDTVEYVQRLTPKTLDVNKGDG